MSTDMTVVRVTLLSIVGHGAAATSAAFSGRLIQLAGMGQVAVQGRVVTFQGDRADSRSISVPWADVEAWSLEELCTRPLDVKGVWDTSDTWIDLVLDIDWNDRSNRVHLRMMASGFEGPDAPLVTRALAAIEKVADEPPPSPPLPEPHQGIYGFHGGIAALAEQLAAALGQRLYPQDSPVLGEWYASVDLGERAQALATLRRIDEEARDRPELTLQCNQSDPYYPAIVSDPSAVLLFVSALPEQLDGIEDKLRDAGVEFERVQRGLKAQ